MTSCQFSKPVGINLPAYFVFHDLVKLRFEDLSVSLFICAFFFFFKQPMSLEESFFPFLQVCFLFSSSFMALVSVSSVVVAKDDEH